MKIEAPMLMIGGTNRREMIRQLQASTPAIVIGTPGRTMDMISRGYLDMRALAVFVLDECDEMLSRGFKDTMYEIFQYLPPECQVGCFSATMPEDVQRITDKFMRDTKAVVLKPTAELKLKGLKQFWIDVGNENNDRVRVEEDKLTCLLDLYETLTISQSMIFLNQTQKIDKLADRLGQKDFAVGVVHSQLERADRLDAMDKFKKGLTRVLLCSDLLARGIDVQGVSVVVNYDMPNTHNDKWMENYYHRIGRCSRYGKKGISINFLANQEDVHIQQTLEKHYDVSIEEFPEDADQYLRG